MFTGSALSWVSTEERRRRRTRTRTDIRRDISGRARKTEAASNTLSICQQNLILRLWGGKRKKKACWCRIMAIVGAGVVVLLLLLWWFLFSFLLRRKKKKERKNTVTRTLFFIAVWRERYFGLLSHCWSSQLWHVSDDHYLVEERFFLLCWASFDRWRCMSERWCFSSSCC